MTTAQPIAAPGSPDSAPDGAAAPSVAPRSAGDGPPGPERESLIRARGLTKKFGEFVAVDAIDFDVAPGESFGFLGTWS